MKGTPRLMVEILYGTGIRLNEILSLRVKDVDFDRGQIAVRFGKGNKDRFVMLPTIIRARLITHLKNVKDLHTKDIRNGFGSVYLPFALEQKYPQARKEVRWQYLFPAGKISPDPRSGVRRRHHIFKNGLFNPTGATPRPLS